MVLILVYHTILGLPKCRLFLVEDLEYILDETEIIVEKLVKLIHTVEKGESLSLSKRIFHEINYLVDSLIKLLLLRNFCSKPQQQCEQTINSMLRNFFPVKSIYGKV